MDARKGGRRDDSEGGQMFGGTGKELLLDEQRE